MNEVHGYICSPKLYEYKGVVIEYTYSGPCPLTKRGTPRQRWTKDLVALVTEFDHLPNREDYRVGGGCQRF